MTEEAARQVLERSRKILAQKSETELTVGDLSLVTEEAGKARENEARKELQNILDGRTIGALGFAGVDPRERNQPEDNQTTVNAAMCESQEILVEMQRKCLEKREKIRRIEAAVFAVKEKRAEQQRQIEQTERRTAFKLAKERKERGDREFELGQRQRDFERFAVEMAPTSVFDFRYEPAARLRDIETMKKIRQQIIEELKSI